MSLITEYLRLDKARDMLMAAEKLKLAGVHKWKRLGLSVVRPDENYTDNEPTPDPNAVTEHGSGIYTIASDSYVSFNFYVTHPDDDYPEYDGIRSRPCIVVFPIGESTIANVNVDDISDNSYDLVYISDKDRISDGLVTYDSDVTIRYGHGQIDIATDSSGRPTTLFLAVYETTVSNEDGYIDVIDGTETIDELAVSIYHWNEPTGAVNTGDATALTSDVAEGKTFWARHQKLTGTCPVKTNAVIRVDYVNSVEKVYLNGSLVANNILPSAIYKSCEIGLAVSLQSKLDEWIEIENLLKSV